MGDLKSLIRLQFLWAIIGFSALPGEEQRPEKSSHSSTETRSCPIAAAPLLCRVPKRQRRGSKPSTARPLLSHFPWSRFQVFGAICHCFFHHATSRKCISSLGLDVQDYFLHNSLLADFRHFERNIKLCSPWSLLFKTIARSCGGVEVISNH